MTGTKQPTVNMAEMKSDDTKDGCGLHGASAASDEDRTTAQRAMSNFDAGEFDKCLGSLTALAQTRPKDVKLIHNRAVTEFYRSGQKKVEALRRSLNDLYSKVIPDWIKHSILCGGFLY